MAYPIPQSIACLTASASFMLIGNAITQSYMTIPALLCNFPQPSNKAAHAAQVSTLAAQWRIMHAVGNSFFRPISTLAILGYSYSAYSCYTGSMKGDWRLYAFAALCHLSNVVHSAVNLQPVNAKLDVLGENKVEDAKAEEWARYWIECNKWRIVFPLLAGTQAVAQAFLNL